uniref:Uncharacterized protein n=1 Tax=Grammatophora oceanica TaxID=210454 RepID=A0A7S1UN74_9STRA|mmetsp:Transcript_10235/g.14940  ORF Transcript_10235/g.14940 Transcript_10235/m.14940 type:complete len:364 (+) Transcript_10235:57-1148(+)|eukprot:CAMPEP_0194046918 /NCGR_PEP_ID=MMETSP0009_2-20130614/22980_1 /TAXON_ID=210454 /ORGANISM="Grammatophora oceanica, Strain CCMP 410" /LENGTH=363 /DNA_ID=CAMNT_0038692387 /DNA_START=56 /DNA_END=1147 /DNA_ORIENTATION=-
MKLELNKSTSFNSDGDGDIDGRMFKALRRRKQESYRIPPKLPKPPKDEEMKNRERYRPRKPMQRLPSGNEDLFGKEIRTDEQIEEREPPKDGFRYDWFIGDKTEGDPGMQQGAVPTRKRSVSWSVDNDEDEPSTTLEQVSSLTRDTYEEDKQKLVASDRELSEANEIDSTVAASRTSGILKAPSYEKKALKKPASYHTDDDLKSIKSSHSVRSFASFGSMKSLKTAAESLRKKLKLRKARKKALRKARKAQKGEPSVESSFDRDDCSSIFSDLTDIDPSKLPPADRKLLEAFRVKMRANRIRRQERRRQRRFRNQQSGDDSDDDDDYLGPDYVGEMLDMICCGAHQSSAERHRRRSSRFAMCE